MRHEHGPGAGRDRGDHGRRRRRGVLPVKDHPDEDHPPGHSTIAVVIEVRKDASVDEVGQRLVKACAYTAPQQRLKFEATSDRTFVVETRPKLGVSAQARLTGCLGDLVFDHVVTQVASVEHHPVAHR